MSVKVLGILFILISGIFVTLEVGKKYDKRIENLNMFYMDFNFILSRIFHLKSPVNEIINIVEKEKEKEILNFYKCVFDYYENGKEELLEEGFKNELYLEKKDKETIYSFFKSVGNYHYENQLNNLKVQIDTLNMLIKEAKENKKKHQKSKCVFTMCMFFLVIIFLI